MKNKIRKQYMGMGWITGLMSALPMQLMAAESGEANSVVDTTLGEIETKMTGHMESLLAYLPLIAASLVVLLLTIAVVIWVGRWQWPFVHLSKNGFLQNLLRQILQWVILALGILLALDIANATALVGAVLGTAGVVGLAVGFAFRDVVENYLAGVLLSLRHPFAPNDHIAVDGYEGKVIRLTSRATILLSFDGNHIRIPNATVFKSSMINYTRNPLRRFDFVIGVGTGENLTRAKELGVETMVNMKSLVDDPAPSALLDEPGDSSIGVHFYGWVDQNKNSLGKTKSEAIRLVLQALDGEGIDMPEPIHRVRIGHLQTIGQPEPGQPKEPEKSRVDPVQLPPEDLKEQDTSAQEDIDQQLKAEQAQHSETEDLLDRDTPPE